MFCDQTHSPHTTAPEAWGTVVVTVYKNLKNTKSLVSHSGEEIIPAWQRLKTDPCTLYC
jgi:hypothetical protein